MTDHFLVEVSSDWETLLLEDGSKWSVRPNDIPIVVTWLPTASITVKLVDPDSAWPYELTNLDEDISVYAMKIAKKRKGK